MTRKLLHLWLEFGATHLQTPLGTAESFAKTWKNFAFRKASTSLPRLRVTAFRTGKNGEITSVKVAKKAAETMDVVGDVFVLAAGIESGKIARMAGVNLPIYPLKGSIVDIPLKVKFCSKEPNETFYRKGVAWVLSSRTILKCHQTT